MVDFGGGWEEGGRLEIESIDLTGFEQGDEQFGALRVELPARDEGIPGIHDHVNMDWRWREGQSYSDVMWGQRLWHQILIDLFIGYIYTLGEINVKLTIFRRRIWRSLMSRKTGRMNVL